MLKPYDVKEIITRSQRLLNKQDGHAHDEQLRIGNLLIDAARYEVYASGNLISLTFREYELLKFLASNPGRVFTRDALLNQVWGEDYYGGDRTVDVHIRRLREKNEDPIHIYIDTVRNIGYRFKTS